jgi:hypothetical protein
LALPSPFLKETLCYLHSLKRAPARDIHLYLKNAAALLGESGQEATDHHDLISPDIKIKQPQLQT